MSQYIREVQENDLDALLQFYLSLHEESVPEASNTLHAVWERILANSNYHIFVGEVDDQLVSSCTLVVIENLTRGLRPYALIENVVTHEGFRKRGYASALLAKAVEAARAAGCYKVMLLTGSKEDSTLHFYEQAGFSSQDKTAFIRWL